MLCCLAVYNTGDFTEGTAKIQRAFQTRPKKIAEGGVCTRQRADDVPRSVIHSCSRKASLKCKTDPYKFETENMRQGCFIKVVDNLAFPTV